MDRVDDMILVTEIADTGSFTQAGARLGMSKSTISQRVAHLEERLGLRLFNRSTRHISVTSSGQVYLEYCRRIRAEVAAANLAMASLKDQPIGTLKITCPEVTASHFMPSFLGGFAKKFPRVTVELIATNRHLDLIRERVDFAFRVGSVSSQDLVIRKISTIKRVLVASPGYVAISAPLREPVDLLQHRCLLHDALPDWTLISGTTRVALQPPAAARSDSMGFLLQSSIGGNGIALLPAYVCQPAVAAGSLIELLPTWEMASYEMTLIFPNLKNQSRAQAAFREFVSAYDFSHFSTGRAPAS